MPWRRICLLLVFVTMFSLTFPPWLAFLEMDTCLDLGGGIENGVCVGSPHPVRTFWNSPWQFKAFSVVPPGLLALVVVAAISAVWRSMSAVPPNTSLERGREG